ncbi:hypothetical protein F5Y19DRAFT_344743 [Xylariaceae sp. FL1651]|nr:hypothetical protein F5Y19DRAFT_344743 [Xylariaceae sp. FL1651]
MVTDDGLARDRVKLEASTGDVTTKCSLPPLSSESSNHGDGRQDSRDGIHSYFESAQWTADGTALLTYSSTNLISGYIVPENLLSAHGEPLTLAPQARIQLPEPSSALSGAPYFSLAEPWTQQLLVSARDHPIQLFYLAPSPASIGSHSPISSYPFTKARSETFLTATSLLWPSPGTHFIAGSRSLLARFDVQRTGDEPLVRIRTIPSERHLSKGGGVGMRGTVSTLGAQPMDLGNGASLVAAGTWTRWVGLYDFAQAGECVATWSIGAAVRAATAERENGNQQKENNEEWDRVGGDGVTQTVWSPCGQYLLICERKSCSALIYDVRVTGKLLGYLAGRDAVGNQRVACDVFPGTSESGGFEVWSGTSSGTVKVWEGVGSREGSHQPAWGWDAHRSTVGSTCVHPSGTVVATCAGSWEFPEEDDTLYSEISNSNSSKSDTGSDDDSDASESDNETNVSEDRMPWMRRRNKESSLKIWSIGGIQLTGEEGSLEEKGLI